MNGETITLNVCPQNSQTVVSSFDPGIVIKPDLNPCINYVSVRGFDRLLILSTLFYGSVYRKQSKREEYCGSVGVSQFCFAECPTTISGVVSRDPFQFACFVYNNGFPSKPSLLPSDVQDMFRFSLGKVN